MNAQDEKALDSVEAMKIGGSRLVVVDFRTSTGLLEIGGQGPAVAVCKGPDNSGWAQAIADRWNLHRELADGLRRLATAAQSFSNQHCITGDLEAALGAAHGLLERVDGRDREPPVGFELRLTVEPGVNADDVARSVKEVVEQRRGSITEQAADFTLKVSASVLRNVADDRVQPHPAMLRELADGLDFLAGELPVLRRRLAEAEDRARQVEARAAKAEGEAKKWEYSYNLYRRAWIRELGGEGKIRPKMHEIDALVGTTEALRLRAESGDAGVRAELDARKEEASRLRRQVLELEGKLEGAAIRAAGAAQALADAGKLGAGVSAEEAVAAVRKAVMADLIGEHVGLLARLQEQAESAREKFVHAQARVTALEAEVRAALEAWRVALGRVRPEAEGMAGLVAATEAVVRELDDAWKAANVPVRGMVTLAEVVAEIRKGRDELLGMDEKAHNPGPEFTP